MLLKEISYKNNNDKLKEWKYNKFELQNIDLVVGYNATGKTRTLKSIKTITDLISGNIKLRSNSESYTIVLTDLKDEYKYSLEYINGVITLEMLTINGISFLERTSNEEGWIYSEKLNTRLEFSISKKELAINAKQDKIQHPFLEKLISWGKNSIFYAFGSNLGKDYLASFDIENSQTKFSMKENLNKNNLKNTNIVVGHLKYAIENYGEKITSLIIKQMKKLEYNIKDINVAPLPNFPIEELEINDIPYSIWVKEKDLNGRTYQHEMSQGMFRALSLIIQTNLCALEKRSDLFIIDDIGEGLDHNRSTKLIQEIIKTAENSNIQLVMATNDRYVMNNIPLKYWQVIQRKGGNCLFFNYKNSKQIFDKFRFTGLSNFDFLTTQFYLGEDK